MSNAFYELQLEFVGLENIKEQALKEVCKLIDQQIAQTYELKSSNWLSLKPKLIGGVMTFINFPLLELKNVTIYLNTLVKRFIKKRYNFNVWFKRYTEPIDFIKLDKVGLFLVSYQYIPRPQRYRLTNLKKRSLMIKDCKLDVNDDASILTRLNGLYDWTILKKQNLYCLYYKNKFFFACYGVSRFGNKQSLNWSRDGRLEIHHDDQVYFYDLPCSRQFVELLMNYLPQIYIKPLIEIIACYLNGRIVDDYNYASTKNAPEDYLGQLKYIRNDPELIMFYTSLNPCFVFEKLL